MQGPALDRLQQRQAPPKATRCSLDLRRSACKDNTRRYIWRLSGVCYMHVHSLAIAVNFAMRKGCHRDPSNFPGHLTPLESEMRRRVRTVVLQCDVRISGQMGMPGMIKDCALFIPSTDTSIVDNALCLDKCVCISYLRCSSSTQDLDALPVLFSSATASCSAAVSWSRLAPSR